MNDIAIKVETFAKKYLIIDEEKQGWCKIFQDVLMGSGEKIIAFLNPFRKWATNYRKTAEGFWILNGQSQNYTGTIYIC